MDDDPPPTNKAFEPVPPVRRSFIKKIIHTTHDALVGSDEELVEQPFPDTRYDGENPDWAASAELHGEFLTAVQAEPHGFDPVQADAIDAFPPESQTVATAVNDQLLHELGHAVSEERRDQLAISYRNLQQMYPVWWRIWRHVLLQPEPIDVADDYWHNTPPLAKLHYVAFRSYYKFNTFLVSSHMPILHNDAERWIEHALVHEKVKHMTKIIVEVGIEHQDRRYDLKPILVDSPSLYRLLAVAMAIYPDHKELDILEIRLMFYNDARTFHVPLPTRVADLYMPIVQHALTQVKDYMDGSLPATNWLPQPILNVWLRQSGIERVEDMIRVNVSAEHARQMESYLNPVLAPDIVDHLQQEYDRLIPPSP